MIIRNKLITVQLIMTVTLILSIIIFSINMYSFMRYDNARIEISHFDIQVKNYNRDTLNTINSRESLINNADNLIDTLDNQEGEFLKIKDSPLFNSKNEKEKLEQLYLSFLLLKDKFLIRYTDSFDDIINPDIEELIKKEGIARSLYLIAQDPKETGLSDVDNMIAESLLTTSNEHYKTFKSEYQLYYEGWNNVKIDLLERLDDLQSTSLSRTILFIILITLIATFLNYRITNKITVNLYQVNDSLKSMATGNFSTKLEIKSSDEFGALSRNFNTLINQLWQKLDSMNIIMSDIGNAMSEELDLNKIQSNILSNITKHIRTDAAAIFSKKGENTLEMTASRGHFPPFFPVNENLADDRPRAARYLKENGIPLDTELLTSCIEDQQALIIKDCTIDNRFPQCQDPDSALFIRSIIIVPLVAAREVIGIFVIIRTNNEKPFSDLDYTNLSSFGDYAALTIDTLEKYNELLEKFEMQKEIGVAADIQQSLVPEKMPKIKGISSSAYTLAAKGVSGDYYDFFRMNKHTIGATVCDVAGKGVPASLVMVMIRTILRLVSSPSRGAAETLTMLNKSISGKIDIDRYATMAFFKIDLLNMKLNYSNAAHHPIQIFRQRTNKFYAVDSPGLPIGIDRDSVFNEKRISIEPGDIIFMYTDGFPEARNRNGDEYSTNRMLKEIRLHCHDNAEVILNNVVADMHKFTGRASQHDDQTILIIKIDEDK